MTVSDIPDDAMIVDTEFLYPQDAFAISLRNDGWKYECEGNTNCYFTIPSEVMDLEAVMTAVPLNDEVEMKIVYEMSCAVDRLPQLAVVIMRTNYLTTGKFFYVESSGLLVWEYTLITHRVPGITIEQAQGMIVLGWSEFETHLKAFATAAEHTLPSARVRPDSESRSATHSPTMSFSRPN